MTGVIPNRFLFDFEFPLAYRKQAPPIDGALAGWTDAELIPPLCRLDDQEPFAPVWACWNETGLFVACAVTGKKQSLRCDPQVFWKGDNLRLCCDMRDARQNRRATRFCQQFFFLPVGGGTGGRHPVAGSAKIHRAREDAPLYRSHRGSEVADPPESALDQGGPGARLVVASRVDADGYALEASVPAACLAGFDPREHDRIGFFYMLEDRDHGQQFLTVGDDLNWHIDPSTWATAVLAR